MTNFKKLYNILNAGGIVLNSDGPLEDIESAILLADEIETDNPGTECRIVEIEVENEIDD
jgi:hypothetical protein